MTSVLSSYWRQRPSTILPLNSATMIKSPGASGQFITVTGDLPTTLLSIPTSSITSASAITSSLPSATSSSSSVSSSVISSLSITSVPASSWSTTSTLSLSSSLPVTSTPAQDSVNGEEVKPFDTYKIVIPCLAAALLLTILVIFLYRQVQKKRRYDARVALSEEYERGYGTDNGTRWLRRSIFGPKTFGGGGEEPPWQRFSEYEKSVKGRPSNDSHIPSFPPPALTKAEASSSVPMSTTIPRIWHDVESGQKFEMVTPPQPRHLPKLPKQVTPPPPPMVISCPIPFPKPVAVKLVPRDEKAIADRSKIESGGSSMSLAEMFADEKDHGGYAIEIDPDSPFSDYHRPPTKDGIHALTHSLRSSSSRERINTSAYPFHTPAQVAASASSSSLAVPATAPVSESIDPFVDTAPEQQQDSTVTDIAATSVGNGMLAPSNSVTIKRKPVPTSSEKLDVVIPDSTLLTPDYISSTTAPAETENENRKLDPIVPTSTLLTPDYISTTATPTQKRITYRSPTESIYGCYQVDDERQASFVDFSVSPKTLG